ncbi:methylmalonyl-CoA mutase subunit beta [Aestuariibaculum suncheonense]|uniref:Methylmalonyl-CoA mutase subunit beta n=1 Tax=Aestuariibaculum suncheonense TaxID=1028745 RepID=A0A8J6UCQ9_9FLAO|nr:methylmalonyl-CoA mutase subunit beta [Aestuariibaculum suncheonense]MBD0836507.1 methylmalonyl-CoA mutase subunit beta [Aestuariibaculum suncheonense]
MNKGLFSEFDAVSTKQWKQKIQFELNGADYQTLVWQSNEDISVKPFYNADDIKDFPLTSNVKTTQWFICDTVFVNDAENANRKALKVIKNGAESIKFIIPNNDIPIETLLNHIDLEAIQLHFELHFLDVEFTKQLLNTVSKPNIFVHTDIIGKLAKTGNWFNNMNADIENFKSIIEITNTYSINSSLYQNAGANMVQQLAYALAHANEYLNILDDDLTSEAKQQTKVIFNVSAGSNYFFEIAKLRALRLLWKTLASEYDINTECQIFTTPSKRNKTVYDYNTNILRSTTECMSAILGGADTVFNLPYDAVYHKSNTFSERIARNQLLILKHESYFDKVNNPADGAYYIESLTQQLAEKALILFKDIEANGGFLKQLKSGTIQRKIKESAQKEQIQFDNKEEILVGSNKYPNPDDRMKATLELYPFVKTHYRKTLIEPIIEKRLAETLEQKRLNNEN